MGLIPGQIIEYTHGNSDKITRIPAEELSRGSCKKVKASCDCCGEVKDVIYKNYISSTETNNGKYFCTYCIHHNKTLKEQRSQKMQTTMLERYGVRYPLQVEEFKEKSIETCINIYGAPNPMQNLEIKQKAQNTCENRYGFKNPKQVPEFKIKAEETCLNNHGTKYYLQSDEGKDSYKKTCLEKYGVDHVSKVPEIHEKQLQSRMSGDNGIPVSKEEKYISELICDAYPQNAMPNIQKGSYVFDILLSLNGVNIDIECDGAHWHPTDSYKDIQRDHINRRKGYKILRIRYRSIADIPSVEEIIDAINILLLTDKQFIRIGYME